MSTYHVRSWADLANKIMASSSRTCISHPAHLQHELTLEGTGKFVCNGCHEYGIGERYRCQTCGYNLHDKCAFEEGTKIVHPLLKNIELQLRFAPAGPEGSKLVCDACGDDDGGENSWVAACPSDVDGPVRQWVRLCWFHAVTEKSELRSAVPLRQR